LYKEYLTSKEKNMHSPLVSTEWLNANLASPDLLILDVSMSKVIGQKPIIYDQLSTIPNSYKVSIEKDLSDLTASSLHAFPSAEQVQQLSAQFGFSMKSTLIIYDDQGIYSAPRAWWIFTSLGYDNVFILDGGLPKWLAEKRPIANKHRLTAQDFVSVEHTPHCNSTTLAPSITTSDMLLLNIKSEKSLVIDVRSKDRFLGLAAEPRAGIRSGHIPKSINLPFGLVVDSTKYKSANTLKAQFEQLGCQHDSSLIFSCGSGITACIVLVAALIAGFDNVSLYDGSWAEGGADKSLPIAK
jgi:thiosulfate/3-mercaptopyruvate sulfurtransferase